MKTQAASFPADTWHGPTIDSIALTRFPTRGDWGGDRLDWMTVRLQCGCETLDEAASAEILELDPLSETARIRLADGRERWIDARSRSEG